MYKNCMVLICISRIAYIANNLGFYYLAAILDAILDISARHQLCRQFHILKIILKILVAYITRFVIPDDLVPHFLALIVAIKGVFFFSGREVDHDHS